MSSYEEQKGEKVLKMFDLSDRQVERAGGASVVTVVPRVSF